MIDTALSLSRQILKGSNKTKEKIAPGIPWFNYNQCNCKMLNF